MKTLLFARPGIPRKIYEWFINQRLGKIDETVYTRKFSKTWELVRSEAERRLASPKDLELFKELTLNLAVTIKPTVNDVHYALSLYEETSSLAKSRNQPLTIFETGTAKAFSSLVMSLAVSNHKGGTVHTIDLVSHSEKRFWNAIGDKTHGKRARRDLIARWPKLASNIVFHEGSTNEVTKTLPLERIDLAFLDAQHDYHSVMSEFEFVNQRQVKGSVIVLDDVDSSLFPGIYKAVHEIKKSSHPYDVEIIPGSGVRKSIAILRKK